MADLLQGSTADGMLEHGATGVPSGELAPESTSDGASARGTPMGSIETGGREDASRSVPVGAFAL